MAKSSKPKASSTGTATIGFEAKLWVTADVGWPHLQASARQPTIGKTVDDAMVAIERDNPRLVTELNAQFEESAKLEQAIKANSSGLGHDIKEPTA